MPFELRTRPMPSSASPTWQIAVAFLFWAVVGITSGRTQSTRELQHRWEVDPPLEDTWIALQSYSPVQMNLADLDSPLSENRLNIAQQHCRDYDNPNFAQREAAIKKLIATLQSGEANVQIRRSMISAAILLGDASLGEPLWAIAKDDPLVRGFVERALIKWKNPAAIDTWRRRIKDPNLQSSELLIALEGLAVVGSEADVDDLQSMLMNHRLSSACKFHASRALGAVVSEGQNGLAKRILNSNADQRHLLAALVLSRHSGETTTAQLKDILENGSASAQVVAYRTLAAVNSAEALGYARQMIASSDNSLRRLAIEVLQSQVTADNLKLQATAITDRNPTLRQLVTHNLLLSASQGERESIDNIVTQYIDSEQWTGVEQAIVLTAKLHDRTRCEKLLELLEHPRPEVNMTAAWALMELGEEPAVLASMLVHALQMTKKLADGVPVEETDLIRLSYLHEGFGRNLYRPAYEMLLKYVPKDNFKFGIISRASAIWALGKMNRDEDNTDLRKRLHERILDTAPLFPEDLLVRFASILACGEMGQADTLNVIGLFIPSTS